MRYTDCHNYSALDIPGEVWGRYNRYLCNYGACALGRNESLGWFIYDSLENHDVLLWSEVYS